MPDASKRGLTIFPLITRSSSLLTSSIYELPLPCFQVIKITDSQSPYVEEHLHQIPPFERVLQSVAYTIPRLSMLFTDVTHIRALVPKCLPQMPYRVSVKEAIQRIPSSHLGMSTPVRLIHLKTFFLLSSLASPSGSRHIGRFSTGRHIHRLPNKPFVCDQ